jgi:hypothetical protein
MIPTHTQNQMNQLAIRSLHNLIFSQLHILHSMAKPLAQIIIFPMCCGNIGKIAGGDNKITIVSLGR